MTVTLDIGQGDDLAAIRARALSCGARRAHAIDARDELVREFLLCGISDLAEDGSLPIGGLTPPLSNIPPEQMAQSLAIMIPAMNIDDRTELLGGMRAGAPPEVFEGIWGLTGSVLPASDFAALGARLGLAA